MRVAVRPHNDIRKLFVAFAISFLAMHQLVITIVTPSSKITTDAKTCVETDTDQFYCSDDPKEARKRARKTTNYYLTNFGVRQTIEGSDEEQKKMIAVSAQMEQYLKTWITRYDHIESLKEKCINKHDKCVFWASIGECTENPGYMEGDCMLACQNCEKLLVPSSKAESKSEL